MTTTYEVIAMPDGSGVVTKECELNVEYKHAVAVTLYKGKVEHAGLVRDAKKINADRPVQNRFDGRESDIYQLLLTINRKEPLEGVPNVNTEVSLEELAREAYPYHPADDTYQTDCERSAWVKGYKAAGGFTEEQVREAFRAGAAFHSYFNDEDQSHMANVPSEDAFLESLRKPSLPAQVEIEWGCKNKPENFTMCPHCTLGGICFPVIKHLHGQPQVKLIY